jgi:hypothetical protein
MIVDIKSAVFKNHNFVLTHFELSPFSILYNAFPEHNSKTIEGL